MTCESPVVACYTQLALTVSRMLTLAREGCWGELPALDRECNLLVTSLRSREAETPMHDDDRRHVAAVIRRIQADQREIATLIQPQLRHLMQRLEELHRGKKASAAYRAA